MILSPSGAVGRAGSPSAVSPVGLPLAVLLAVALLLVVPVATPASTPAAAVGDDEQEAVELLERSGLAWSQVTFSGTQYLTVGGLRGHGAVLEVSHRAGGSTRVRVVGAGAHEVPRGAAAGWLAAAGPVDLLVDSYEVSVAGRQDVAGRPADVVEARRADGTLAARLWVDAETGLPLRRELLDPDGSLHRASAFVDVEVRPEPVTSGDEPAGATDTPGSWGEGGTDESTAAGGSATTLDHEDLVALRGEGLSCPEELGRGLVLYEAREVTGAGDEPAVQLSYSDGLLSVSVFEQRGRLDEARLAGFETSRAGGGTVYTRTGPPSWATWSTGETVVTVVTDDPELVPAVLAAVPPRDGSGEQGVLAWLARGASRLAGWFNPFD